MAYIVDVVLRFIRYCLNLISYAIGEFFYPSKQRFLPPIKTDLLLHPGTVLASKIKSGKVKSEEVVKAYIERCKAVNGDLNAMVDDNFDDALKEARLVDARVQREMLGNRLPDERSVHEYPFLGVPFTTKDSIGAKGKSFTGGLYIRKGFKAEVDSEAVRRMKEIGGAIFLGITNVPELVMWCDSFNRVYGQTNNPYDKSRIPGGSSGGEGSLIAAAGSVIGIGSDIGGSIRIPSHSCGIYGHKTTPRVVSVEGLFPPKFSDVHLGMCSLGPMCRYACDLRPMLKVLAGDALKLDDKPLSYSNLNVYYVRSLGDPLVTPVDVELKQAVDRVAKYFIENGSRTIELDTEKRFYDLRYGFDMFFAMFSVEGAPTYFDGLTDNHPETLNPYLELFKCAIGRQDKYTAAILLSGTLQKLGFFKINKKQRLDMVNRLKKDLHDLLGDNGVLLCPTLPEVALKHNQTILKFNNILYTCLFNLMNVAITVVPVGLDRHGMPITVEVIAKANNDNLTLQVAEELDKHFGGWVAPCPLEI